MVEDRRCVHPWPLRILAFQASPHPQIVQIPQISSGVKSLRETTPDRSPRHRAASIRRGTARWELPRIFLVWWGMNEWSPSIKSKPGMQGGSGSGDPRAASRGAVVHRGNGEPEKRGVAGRKASGVRREGSGLRIKAEGQGCRGAEAHRERETRGQGDGEKRGTGETGH